MCWRHWLQNRLDSTWPTPMPSNSLRKPKALKILVHIAFGRSDRKFWQTNENTSTRPMDITLSSSLLRKDSRWVVWLSSFEIQWLNIAFLPASTTSRPNWQESYWRSRKYWLDPLISTQKLMRNSLNRSFQTKYFSLLLPP